MDGVVMTQLPCALAETAERVPNAIGLVSDSARLTYGHFDACVAQCAACLRDTGIKEGSRLAIAMPSSPDYIILILALMRLGAVACPLSMRLPGPALAEAVETLGAVGLVTAGSEPPTSVRSLHFTRLMGDEANSFRGGRRLDGDRSATILYTSGSGGTPKPAVHAYRNHYMNAQASNRNLPVQPGDRWLLSLPLYHVSGLGAMFRCLLGGGAIVVPTQNQPLAKALNTYSITHISLVATQLFELLKHDGSASQLAGLRAVLLGGGPMSAQLIRRAFNKMIPLYTTYGMTETASQAATTPPPDFTQSSYPPAYPLIDGSLSVSAEGEILIRGDTLFKGYLKGDALDLPLTEDGWFATGDLGEFDNETGLRITGRKDHQFFSGGENIQPEEIERCICQVEGVAHAVVVPVEQEKYGQRPVAFVRSLEDTPVDTAAIREHLLLKLPRFKIPSTIHPWPTQLSAPDVKVSRKDLEALARTLQA